MTDTTPVSIDDVRTLVAERRRFDEWLEALESRRSDTPDHVYARVHGDYVSRRDNVMTQLHAHVPGLEQLLGELDARATDLARRSRAEEDERAEAMLRHAVGEYDDSKWEDVRNRVESTLATLDGEREALDREREDVRGLLSNARPMESVAIEHEVADNAPDTDDHADDSRPEARSTETLDSLSDADFTDDVSGADSVPDERQTSRDTPDWLGAMTPASVPSLQSRPSDNAPQAESEQEVDDRSGKEDDLDFTSDESDERESSDVFGDAQSTSRDAGVAGDAGTEKATPSAFDELAFLRSVIDPQASSPSSPSGSSAPSGNTKEQKTLRCTECGTMNLPTEWYCERCGGELAAF